MIEPSFCLFFSIVVLFFCFCFCFALRCCGFCKTLTIITWIERRQNYGKHGYLTEWKHFSWATRHTRHRILFITSIDRGSMATGKWNQSIFRSELLSIRSKKKFNFFMFEMKLKTHNNSANDWISFLYAFN